MNRSTHKLLGLGLAMAIAALGLSAAPAVAAPSLAVTLERDEAEFPTVHHSDERVDFTVKVKNDAAVLGSSSEGERLSCATTNGAFDWNFDSFIHYSFEFEWVRDGIVVAAWAPPERVLGMDAEVTTYISTYEVQAADQEHAIQCVVKGTNGAGTGSDVVASQPVVVTNPQPATAPPTPNGLANSVRLALISGSATTAGEKLTCAAPTAGWSISNESSPISWSFEWLRDGEPAPGAVTPVSATESEYELTPADVSAPVAPAIFQCVAKATNAGGATLVESPAAKTTFPAPEFAAGTEGGTPEVSGNVPKVEPDANTIAGPMTLELELPDGDGTFAFNIETEPEKTEKSWACDKIPASGLQPARVVCTREELLSPQEEFPELKVITALGADVSDTATVRATAFGGGSAPASDEIAFPIAPAIPFGLSQFTASLFDEAHKDYARAGGHPFAGESDILVNQKRALVPTEPAVSPYLPVEPLKQLIIDLPRGIVGNQLALPELCPSIEEVAENKCPPGSLVGGIQVLLSDTVAGLKIYAIEPEFGAPAQFAFADPLENIYTFTPRLRADDGYAISLVVAPTPEADFLGATATLCDFGVVEVGVVDTICKQKDEPGANPKPLITNPTRCPGVPLTYRARANSWTDPGTFIETTPFVGEEPISGCEAVSFEPQADLQPTSQQADSPTGLDVELSMPTEGLEKGDGCHEKQGDESSPLVAECISQSSLKQAKITFPEGMAVNASAGQGLNACAKDQIKLGTNDPITCPQSSKIGSVEIDTPVIEETLKGDVYIAKQGDVEGSKIGLYMVFDSPKDGILVKLPARVDTDPQTGQLVATVNEVPEQPFSAVRMHFPGGPRATLLTPPKCGTYKVEAELTPWSGGAPVTQVTPFEINQGPNGSGCPNGALAAKLNAGSENATAGKPSPFSLRLSREDGSGRFTGLNVTTPPGESAFLKDIPYCPESAINMARAREKESLAILEANNPSCAAASQIGIASAGAGGGSEPLYVETGKAYLTASYKGAPVSLALIAPALAGPLDLGTVVVQTALNINPETAQVSAISDAIPTILHGLLLDIRDIRVALNRPHFTLNPTNCEPLSVNAVVRGEGGATQQLSNHFQVSGCESLKMKKRFSLSLTGGTKRGDHPQLRTVLTAGEGEANISQAAVTVPRSEFLDQAHIRTICTRVQFAADACPKGSVYGHATAYTPLLGYPVSGPVYLRSSSHKLPDLVVAVRGPDYQPIEAVVVGRIDSIKGQIRATIEGAPDVPVSKFVLTQQGGKKGLLVNSRDICASTNRATVVLTGQNGKVQSFRPVVTNGKCRQHRRAKSKHHR